MLATRLRSSPCTEADLRSETFRPWAERLRPAWDPGNSGALLLVHRKVWEWLFIAQALFERDMLRPGRRGLGFGVGQDPLSALFASFGCQVVATDLDYGAAAEAGWVATDQHAREVAQLNADGICDPADFERLVTIRAVDMNAIPDDLDGFDFSWSACAFEHLGSIRNGSDFVVNQMSCLTDGGVSVHTTEYNVSSTEVTVEAGDTVLYRRGDLEALAERLRGAGHAIDLDLDPTGSTAPADRHVDVPPFTDTHLKVQIGAFVTTSVGLIVEKGGVAGVDVGDRRDRARAVRALEKVPGAVRSAVPDSVAGGLARMRNRARRGRLAHMVSGGRPDRRGSQVRAVHQFIPVLVDGDAVGNHTLKVQRLLESMGFESRIYVDSTFGDVRVPTEHFSLFADGQGIRDGTVLLYQSCSGSAVGDFVLARPEPLIVNYHNITPGETVRGWDTRVARACDAGRVELGRLATRSLYAIADSLFNEADLRSCGFTSTCVAPILLDTTTFIRPTDLERLAKLKAVKERGGANILFVGRVAPHKAQHDVVAAFAHYRSRYDPDSRLYLVGISAMPRYLDALRDYADELGVGEAVHIVGFVNDAELCAYYRTADVFLCLSDHEGFCVPLLEAMNHRVPIVAYRAAAVPETVGEAGLLVETKGPAQVARAVDWVVSDDLLRDELQVAGDLRLEDFAPRKTAQAFRGAVEGALARVGAP